MSLDLKDYLFLETSFGALHNGHVLDVLPLLPSESVHCIVTSPPYWGLRDYGLPPQVWGGDPGCEHDWAETNVPTGGGNGASFRRDRAAWHTRGGHQPGFCVRCGAWLGSYGLEPTPDLYVEHTVQVFREARPALRKDGTLWLNMGDCYATGAGKVGECPGGGPEGEKWKAHFGKSTPGSAPAMKGMTQPNRLPIAGLKPKDLVGIPWRVAFGLQADGWRLRSPITLCKLNPMPESVTGSAWVRHRIKSGRKRVDWKTRPKGWQAGEGSHETIPEGNYRKESEATIAEYEDCPGCPKCEKHDGYVLRMSAGRPTSATEMMFLLTKSASYFYDSEAVKEGVTEASQKRCRRGFLGSDPVRDGANHYGDGFQRGEGYELTSRNLRNWWPVVSEPFPAAHFATFGQKWITPCILAGTSEKGCCPKCGAPWVRLIERTGHENTREPAHQPNNSPTKTDSTGWAPLTKGTNEWRPSCSCKAGDPVPSVVLDPFIGSMTTGLVAERLGRKWIGIELSLPYCSDIAAKRLAQGRLVL